METREHTLGKREQGDFNFKNCKKQEEISFSQEYLQAVLYYDKEPQTGKVNIYKSI